jgi:hypothetical protein
MFSGVDSVRGAQQLLIATQDRRDSWPYVHIFPPFNADDVFRIGTAFTEDPTAGQTAVLTYTVNAGKIFYLTDVIFGASVQVNPGDALFTLDRNSPPNVPDSQFQPEQGLVNVPVALGSFAFRPFPVKRAREFGPLDVVRVKATNVNLPIGSPTSYVCGIFGYEVPVLDVRSHR